MPDFSCIIPTLNEEKFVPKLIQDLCRQNGCTFEVIIVDGQSEDNTKECVLAFEKKLNLRFFTVEKRNVSYQRNFGSRHAKGNFLVFLDADARIGPNFLKRLKKEIEKSHYFLYIPAVYPQNDSFEDKVLFKAVNIIIETSQLTTRPFASSGSLMFDKTFFRLLDGFDEGLYLSEDHDIVQRAKNRGVTAKFLKNVSLKFSLRRIQKEGRLDLFKKYLIASIHHLRKHRIQTKIFEYEMGGGYYSDTKTLSKRRSHSDTQINQYLMRFKQRLTKLLMEQ